MRKVHRCRSGTEISDKRGSDEEIKKDTERQKLPTKMIRRRISIIVAVVINAQTITQTTIDANSGKLKLNETRESKVAMGISLTEEKFEQMSERSRTLFKRKPKSAVEWNAENTDDKTECRELEPKSVEDK